MAPALIWSAWSATHNQHQPLPRTLVVVPFLICPVLYWILVQSGRRDSNPPAAATPAPNSNSKPLADSVRGPQVRPINQAEETQLRNCFPWSVYYIHNIEYRPQAPAAAYQKIRENVEEQFDDRFLVVFQEGLNGKPFFALVPNPQRKDATRVSTEPLTRPVLALALLAATLVTTTIIGLAIAGVSIPSGEELLAKPALLLQGLPYALALMSILGIHELGHYLTARFYKIRSTLPYFIPVPFFLGTFGAFIQMRSPVPNRKALFDVSIAGPMSGLVVALPLLLWGLAHSTVVPLSAKSEILNFDALNPRYSLLLALLSKLVLGGQLMSTKAIHLHPVAVAGCLGLIVTALNLMPVGQLDGGHIVHAMFGQRTGAAIGQIARLLLLGLSLFESWFLLWAIILFFMPIVDEPALNDVSELDNRRDLWGLLALVVLIMIILPVPKALTQLLQI